MIEIVLGVLAIVGGVAVLLDLGGIATGYARFQSELLEPSDRPSRLPLIGKSITRRRQDPALRRAESQERLRYLTFCARLSGLTFVAIGVAGIAFGLNRP